MRLCLKNTKIEEEEEEEEEVEASKQCCGATRLPSHPSSGLDSIALVL